MSIERRIKGLKIRQKSLLASFGLIKSFVDTYEEESDACEIPVRLESLDALWTDFKQVQGELEALDEATIDQQLKQRADFETAYYRVKGFLLSNNKTPSSPRMNTSTNLSSQFPGSTSHVRLPDIKLPVFCGNLDEWLNFHDLFVSLVHSSAELSNIQKFYYLRSSLAGDALKLVQTIPLSANNYSVAWNLLVDHFQNTARLKQSYLDALFEFPSLKRESAADLHSLVEKFEANVKVLKQLGEKTEFWDIILIRMLSIRLDPTTRRDWEEYSSTKDAIAFMDLTSFIQRRVTVLQTINGKSVEPPSSTQQFRKPAQRPIASNGASQVNTGRKCVICSDQHPLYLCSLFAELDLKEKEREVRHHQLCRNCLRKGHHVRDCSSSSFCRKCRGRHHTQLCSGEDSVAANSRTSESSHSEAPIASTSGEQPKASVSATIHEPSSYSSTGQTQNNILLATAVVKLVVDDGTPHLARALLDSGSECCFITESFSQLIKAQRKKISVPISGIGQSSANARYKIVSTIRSRVSNYSTSAEFLVLPKVTIDLPSASFDASSWKIPPGVHLADPSFHEAKAIDIVIGAEIFFELFKVPGRIPLGDSLPTLVNSVLGWIVSGKVSYGTPSKLVISNVALIADRHRFTEHRCSTEEDATPSSAIEPTSREELFRYMFNVVDRHIACLKTNGRPALVEIEIPPSIVYPASAEPSLSNLQMEKISIDRIHRIPATNCPTTSTGSEEMNKSLQHFIMKDWKQLTQSSTGIRVEKRLIEPSQLDDNYQQIVSSLSRSPDEKHCQGKCNPYRAYLRIRGWIIGARKLARLTMHIFIAFVSGRYKLVVCSTDQLSAARYNATRPASRSGVNHHGSTSQHPIHSLAESRKTYITFPGCFSICDVHQDPIANMSTVIFLQALRRSVSCCKLSSNRIPIEAGNTVWTLFRYRTYPLAIARDATDIRLYSHLHLTKSSIFGGFLNAEIRPDQSNFVHVLGNHKQPQDHEEICFILIERSFDVSEWLGNGKSSDPEQYCGVILPPSVEMSLAVVFHLQRGRTPRNPK